MHRQRLLQASLTEGLGGYPAITLTLRIFPLGSSQDLTMTRVCAQADVLSDAPVPAANTA